MILNIGGSGTLTFDYATPDEFSAEGTLWFWSDLQGWWEPPAPVRETLVGPSQSGALLTAEVTTARWAPRDITLECFAALNGSQTAYIDALNTIAAMGTPFGPDVYGSLSVIDDVPKAVAVRLGSDRIKHELIGQMGLLKVTIPLVAHDPLRTVIAGGARVL